MVSGCLLEQHWVVAEYAPEIRQTHVASFPSIAWLLGALPGARAVEWEVPADCSDLFMAALWARPEAYLDPAIRSATSAWHQLPAPITRRAVERLGADLEAGRWDARHANLRRTSTLDVGVRIVIAELTATDDRRDSGTPPVTAVSRDSSRAHRRGSAGRRASVHASRY